jgi:hypothetical protein
MNYCNLTILPRRDLEENWLTENPVLRDKEFIVSVDKDTIRYKLGDGKSNYIDLPFMDLFDALTQGSIYARPHQPSQFRSVKLRLLDGDLLKHINKNYTAIN